MAQATKRFIVDENGEKTAIILPIEEYHELLEDIEDLAIVAERREERTEPLSMVRERLEQQSNGVAKRAKNEYTAVIKESGHWWIGWVEEVPGVTCQEATREELLETLEITLKEILELNREDALADIGEGYEEERIVV